MSSKIPCKRISIALAGRERTEALKLADKVLRREVIRCPTNYETLTAVTEAWTKAIGVGLKERRPGGSKIVVEMTCHQYNIGFMGALHDSWMVVPFGERCDTESLTAMRAVRWVLEYLEIEIRIWDEDKKESHLATLWDNGNDKERADRGWHSLVRPKKGVKLVAMRPKR